MNISLQHSIRLCILWLAIFRIVFSLTSDSGTDKRIRGKPELIDTVIWDNSLLINIIKDSTLIITNNQQSITAQHYFTEPNTLSSVFAHDFAKFDATPKQDLLTSINEVMLNPDLRLLSTVFAINQLAIPYHGILFVPSEPDSNIEGEAIISNFIDQLEDLHRGELPPGAIIVKHDRSSTENIRAVFMHEVAHIVLFRLYGNSANPFPAMNPIKEAIYSDVMHQVTDNLRKTYSPDHTFSIEPVEDYFVQGWNSVFVFYRSSDYMSETIVRLPETLARFNIKMTELPSRLILAIQPLMDYWEGINQDFSTYLSNIKTETSLQPTFSDKTSSQDKFLFDLRSKMLLATYPNILLSIHEQLYTHEEIKGFSVQQLSVLNTAACLQALREKLFTVADIGRLRRKKHVLAFLTQPECHRALRDKLFTVNDLKGLIPETLTFLLTPGFYQLASEGLIAIKEILTLDPVHQRFLTENETLIALHEKLYTLADLIKLTWLELKFINKPEYQLALREKLFEPLALKGLSTKRIFLVGQPETLQALREKKLTMTDIATLPLSQLDEFICSQSTKGPLL